MTTQYTPILKLALPVTGELVGTWGDVVNNNITSMVEEAIAGLATINTWSGSPPTNTLTVADGVTATSRCAILECSGAPGANAQVICPAQPKFYIVSNSVTGGYTVTLKTSAGTGISVPSGKAMLLYCDGVDVVEGVNYVASAQGLLSTTTTGVAKITGPAAATTRTYTLPDADTTILTTANTVTVAQGGTGRTSLTSNNLVVGNGTSAVNFIAPGAAGEILVSNGTTWAAGPVSASAVVSFSGGTTGLTPSSPTTGAVVLAGTLGVANGGTGLTSAGASGNFLQSTGSGWTSAFVPKGFANMVVFTSSTTWTIPAGVNNIFVIVIGAGGGGGSDVNGSGGGSSSIASGTQTISTVSATGGGGGTSNITGGNGGLGSGGDANFSGSAGFNGSNSQADTGGQGGGTFMAGATKRTTAGQLYGGGGGAGIFYPGPYYYPGGGGGGGCAMKYIGSLTAGNTLSITVGAGGSGGSGSVVSGSAGASGVVIIQY